MLNNFRRMRISGLLLAAALGLLFTPATSFAAPPKSSLELVPADAELYLSMQRNREQFELIANSHWWAKLRALPAAQLAWAQAMQSFNEPDGPGAMLNQFLADPENKELLEVGVDLVSDEVFVYGDKHLANSARMYMDFSNVIYGAFAAGLVSGIDSSVNDKESETEDFGKIATDAILGPLTKDLADFSTPTLVIGFRSGDKERTARQVDRLVKMLQQQLEQNAPEVAARLKKTKIAGADFWTLSLDAKMLPWDEIEKNSQEDNDLKPEDYKQVFDRLKQLKFVVSIGQLHGYLLLSISESTEQIGRFGQGESIDSRPEFAPLKKRAKERITGISFAGQDMVAATTFSQTDVDRIAGIAKASLGVTQLDEDVKKRIALDVDELASDTKQIIPTPGANLSFSFLTDRGIESFTYDYSENLTLDGSKRLSILDHVGGSPLLMIAGRATYSPEGYATLVKWLKKGRGYVDSYGLPKMDESVRYMYELITQKADPLLVRLDAAIGKMILPSLADSQSALILDARLTSKQWNKHLPPAENELKLIQPALVLGVSDAEQLLRGINEVIAIGKSAADEIRSALVPGADSEDLFPEAKSRKFDSGTVYWYTVPKESGLDHRIAPNFGLSESIATFSIAPRHSRDLMIATPLQSFGPLANTDRPLAMAVHIDFAGMVDAALPWIEYVVTNAALAAPDFDDFDDFDDLEELEELDEEPPAEECQPADVETQMILGMIRQSVQFIKVVRGYSSATYVEGKALVTHGELHLQDLPK